jgi:hypothetical protein
MDAQRRALAAELLAASREHDAAQEDRVARFRNLEGAGLTADLRVQDAGELLRAADDGAWEFVSHAEQVEEVTALIEGEPTVTTELVPIGAGLRVVVKE